MTKKEKDLLIAFLLDTGDIDPDGDVENQFLDWYQCREGQVVRRDALQGNPRCHPGQEAGLRGRTPSRTGRGSGEDGMGRTGSCPRASPLHGPRPRGGELTSWTLRKNPRGGPTPGRSAGVMPTMPSGSNPPKRPGFGHSRRREPDSSRMTT